MESNPSAAEKIKTAARAIFTRKGFAATRTRDIAREAGSNLALLNYYFQSKQNLFNILMLENMQQFLSGIREQINDPATSLDDKIQNLVDVYIDLLLRQPDIPLFILYELRTNPDGIAARLGINKALSKSVLLKQLKQALKKNKNTKPDPMQIILNLFGMTLFPFVAGSLFRKVGAVNDKAFRKLMIDRKEEIPHWIQQMISNK